MILIVAGFIEHSPLGKPFSRVNTFISHSNCMIKAPLSHFTDEATEEQQDMYFAQGHTESDRNIVKIKINCSFNYYAK